ncbi:MAG: response regulator [Clostridia bacterium]|nr:response regulator [Clostridia bacterium]MBR6479344.1 response regulator [Clostridia bacterium]
MNANGTKDRILIVDDSELNRSILSDILCEKFDIVEAADGLEAVNYLEQHPTEVSMVLLDLIMPVMDGMSVLKVMNQNNMIKTIPVVVISADQRAESVEQAYKLGATDFIFRPFDSFMVYRRVINTIMLYSKQKRLEDMVTEQIYERSKNSRMLVSVLAHIVEFRNGESSAHCLNINTITEKLLNALLSRPNNYNIPRADVPVICTASSLHDIGKIAIPESILNKPGKLTPEEFEVIKTHSMEGAKILNAVPFSKDEPLIRYAYEIARWHHERYDGRGYPDRLEGDKIPIAAQVVSIADVYDALTSTRCYKPAYSHEQALTMIRNGECGTFNPLLMECLEEIAPSLREELGKDAALFEQSSRDLDTIADELFSNPDLASSNRSLHLLETEREKFSFFWENTKDIFFEYNAETSVLSFSKAAAYLVDGGSMVVDPLKPGFLDDRFNSIVALELDKVLTHTSYEYTDFKDEVEWNGVTYRIEGKTVWDYEASEPVMTSIYGYARRITKTGAMI